ncbi:hypothetical protein [Nocardia sp. NPDC047038]|uniref:hypothetical protein n=1 Tax=Nocardia sp. NPDC047038 TaxID=3154338 RepID=UPI0033C64B9E
MSKVDDVVGQIKKDYEPGTWDPSGFQDDQAKNSLDALAGLNPDEFRQAFNKLTFTPAWSDLGLSEEVKKQLVEDAGDLKNDPKYKDLIAALDADDPELYIKAKEDEETAKTPKFGGVDEDWDLSDLPGEDEEEGKHAEPVELPIPKGASAQLIALIKDTEYTMQKGFDTLGIRNPKSAPDFSNVLDDDRAMSVAGWSNIRDKHMDLTDRMEKRKTKYEQEHKGVKFDTFDTKVIKDGTFKKLVGIKDELVKDLNYEPTDLTHTGTKITESSGGPPEQRTQVTVYEKNTAKDGDGKYYLTPEAEQRYYVSVIDVAAEDWDKTYAEATKEFQKKAADVDNKNDEDADDHSGDDNKNNNSKNNHSNNNNSGNNNAGNSNSGNNNTGNNNYVPPNTSNSTQQAGSTNDDWSSTYDDLLGGSTDTSGTTTDSGTQTVSDNGTTGTSTSSGYPTTSGSSSPYGNSGTGTTGANATPVGTTATPASSDNGMANAMQQMAMMSAMSGMMNQGNRQPGDDRAYDRAEERDRQEERDRRRERERNAQAATANQAVQQGTPPGVTAATYAGTPPPITAPGTTPEVQIGDTKVQASPPVAEALRKQTQNTALDAISAYQGTAGEITAEHPPAVVNGPGELKTGDILQWERHSALIVRNEHGLFVLDEGRLVPLEPNNPPLVEKYGNFAGFIHPTGLDVGSNTADPGATALPQPKVSSAPPAGPPPVGPPPQV